MTYEIEEQTREAQVTAVGEAILAVGEIGHWFGPTYGSVYTACEHQGVHPVGMPFARYHLLGEGRFRVEAGTAVERPIEPEGDVHPSALPGGRVAVTVHVGPYDGMEAAYHALARWVAERGEPDGDPWEVYLTDPGAEPEPAGWRTEIVQPYRTS